MAAVLIRNSERQSFKRCRQAWWWNFVELLKPQEPAKALRFGDLVHQSLAAYYKPGVRRGPHPAKTFVKLYEEQVEELGRMNMRADDDEKWTDAAEMGEAMLKGYVDKYGERDKEYKVLHSELTFQVPIVVRAPLVLGKRLKVNVVGTVDGLWEHRSSGDIILKEFKTAKAIDLAGLPMDEQAGTYWTYAPRAFWERGIIPPKKYPSHILYTFLRKAMPDARPENELGQKLNLDGSVSKKQPSPLFERTPVYRDDFDRQIMHERVCEEAVEMEYTRQGILTPLKNPGPLYMPNCRGCPFRDMCELHETGGDWEALRDAVMIKWDPYDAHEIVERR